MNKHSNTADPNRPPTTNYCHSTVRLCTHEQDKHNDSSIIVINLLYCTV